MSPGNPMQILVADDDGRILSMVETDLVRRGHTVTTASDGREAWERLQAIEVDLVILDLMMPFLNAIEIVRLMRAVPRLRRTPVIVLTAQPELEDSFRREGLAPISTFPKGFRQPPDFVQLVVVD